MDLPADATEPCPDDQLLSTTAEVPITDWAAVFVDDLQWYAVDEIAYLT